MLEEQNAHQTREQGAPNVKLFLRRKRAHRAALEFHVTIHRGHHFLERPEARKGTEHEAGQKRKHDAVVVFQEELEQTGKSQKPQNAADSKNAKGQEVARGRFQVGEVFHPSDDLCVLAQNQQNVRAADSREDHGANRHQTADENVQKIGILARHGIHRRDEVSCNGPQNQRDAAGESFLFDLVEERYS